MVCDTYFFETGISIPGASPCAAGNIEDDKPKVESSAMAPASTQPLIFLLNWIIFILYEEIIMYLYKEIFMYLF